MIKRRQSRNAKVPRGHRCTRCRGTVGRAHASSGQVVDHAHFEQDPFELARSPFVGHVEMFVAGEEVDAGDEEDWGEGVGLWSFALVEFREKGVGDRAWLTFR